MNYQISEFDYLIFSLNISVVWVLRTCNKVLLFLAMYANKFRANTLTFSLRCREVNACSMCKIVAKATERLPICLTHICFGNKVTIYKIKVLRISKRYQNCRDSLYTKWTEAYEEGFTQLRLLCSVVLIETICPEGLENTMV